MHASPWGKVKMDNVKLIPEVHSTVNHEHGFTHSEDKTWDVVGLAVRSRHKYILFFLIAFLLFVMYCVRGYGWISRVYNWNWFQICNKGFVMLYVIQMVRPPLKRAKQR